MMLYHMYDCYVLLRHDVSAVFFLSLLHLGGAFEGFGWADMHTCHST